jgi:oligopeptide/dipeptide ABC transporter ATP-binding protein
VGELYGTPSHPYTAGLLASIPEADPSIRPGLLPDAVAGEPPSPISPPSGCRFRTRCPKAQERCAIEEPVMREIRPNHFVACHFPLEGERWDALVESNARARVNGPVGVDGPAGMDVNAEGGPVAPSDGPAGADANGAGA